MDLHEEIRKIAYELYEKSGRRRGRELENWLDAEKIVMARRAREEKGGRKIKTPAAADRKTPVKAKASKAAAQDKEPAAAGARNPRAKKTGPKKAEKTGK